MSELDLDAIERNYGDGQITVSLWPDPSDEQRTTHKRLNAVWIAAPLLIAEIRRLREETRKLRQSFNTMPRAELEERGYRRGVEAAHAYLGKWLARAYGDDPLNILSLLDGAP